jgi:hypothetical protein
MSGIYGKIKRFEVICKQDVFLYGKNYFVFFRPIRVILRFRKIRLDIGILTSAANGRS